MVVKDLYLTYEAELVGLDLKSFAVVVVVEVLKGLKYKEIKFSVKPRHHKTVKRGSWVFRGMLK